MESFAIADVAVALESGGSANLEIVRNDLASTLTTLWGNPVAISSSAPDFSKKLTIWLSLSDAAKTAAGASPSTGYVIDRVTAPNGNAVIVVTAPDATNLAYGAYALLEELGARFFHPKQSFLPSLGGVRVPKSLSINRVPAMADRGLQPHTLHPIEYMQVLQIPSDQNLADAKQLIDWLVKTGQNYVQWPLLDEDHVPFAAWKPHAQAIVDYAHSRGVRVGAVVQTWGGSSLQNNFVLVDDPTKGLAPMDAQLDKLMTIDWDVVELALGEFAAANPDDVLTWINHAFEHLTTAFPKIEVNVQNHVGNYPNLWIMYKGQTVFFYHLPQFADAGLGQTVHTLSLFDVYRNWATYAHPNFFLQHDYILQEIPTRRVKYFPESAYWISADSDVPAFLPEYLYSRWNDIHTLVAELKSKGLPPLSGHVMFTSGHEWGYWMTDYLTAKMLWQPDAPLETFLAHYADAYGSCGTAVASDLSAVIDLQSKYIFDQRLLPYVQGENETVEFGYLAGHETHPKRIEFEEVWSMSEADKQGFESSVLAGLEALDSGLSPIESNFDARCRGADAAVAPWCAEVLDGLSVLRLRLQHTDHLYRAVLAKARGGNGDAEYNLALGITPNAQAVIERRKAGYRWDLHRLLDSYSNPTVYDFGYLWAAHSMCYWQRREQQARGIMDDGGVAIDIAGLPSCQN